MNLLALSANMPDLSGRLSAVRPSESVLFLRSAGGLPVPAIDSPGRSIPLHSMIDPEREGNRLAERYQGAGYLIFLGIGGGYHIRPFLQQDQVSRILLINHDLSLFRALLERIDLRTILLDPRVRVLIEKETAQFKEFLLSDYLPAIDGDLNIIPLRPMVESKPLYFQTMVEQARSVIGKIADDYTVQAKFGKKWFINTLANLEAAEKSTVSIRPIHKAIVTGAGPSLELQVDRIESLRKNALLIASDTSLPALLDFGIEPDLVISIDCQQISYHHFLRGLPDHIPLVLDLASPPILTRLSNKTIFLSSGHPFSQYVSAHWRKFPVIDTSGGNVSQAAISLAQFLGADEIFLLGADFSFPEGKSYSRGTYIYPLFRSQESHLQTLESLFFSFILKNDVIIKDRMGDNLRYTTRPMIGYKERLEELLKPGNIRLTPLPGKGVPLKLPQIHPAARSSRKVIGNILAAGAPTTNWENFLQEYLSGIKALPKPYNPLSQYFHELGGNDQSLWLTQFPAAAALRESEEKRAGFELLERVREWTISIIQRHL